MAPSRRRGKAASAAAAAAAAKGKWKIGDLVLAKVKGFPAWPARVSEPKDWGFKEDSKKVFVYFYGTKQIGFCTPADVESFTEEKKATLLGKRHGKGSDFVKAVNEIIVSYEELKRQAEGVDADCTNENGETNDNLSVSDPDSKMGESLPESRLQGEAISPVVGPELKISESTGDDSDFTSLADAAVSELEKNKLHGHTLTEEASYNEVVTYSSRRKLENLLIDDYLPQRRAQSARKSRSSRADTSRHKNFMTPGVDDSSNGDVIANISQDRTGKRSKRPRRSPDDSGKHLINSPALISNGSVDENGADTATMSDGYGFNDEIDVDSAEHCGQELEHDENIDFQSNAVIFKKKRKPNRKRTVNESIEFTAGLDNVEKSDSELSKNGHALPKDDEKLSDYVSKGNGDEHLPLVKRARVRMGTSPHRLPFPGEPIYSQAADKMLDIPIKISDSLNCAVNDSADCNLLADRVNDSANGISHADRKSDNLSPMNTSTSKTIQSREVKNSEPFSSLVDGEAALPPSKRLHRALEAMSANAAEDGQASSDGPAFMNTSINGYSSPSGIRHKVTLESRLGGEVGSSDGALNMDPSIAEIVKASEELTENGRTSNNDDHAMDECCNDTVKAADFRECKLRGSSSFKNYSSYIKDAKQNLNVSSVSGASLESDRGSQGLALHWSDDCEAESSKSAKIFVEPEPQSFVKSLDAASAQERSPASSQQCKDSQLSSEENNCIGTVELPELSLEGFKPRNIMNASIVKGAAVWSPKASISTCREEHISHSNSISDDLVVEKVVSTTQSSSSITEGLDFGRCTSPLVPDSGRRTSPLVSSACDSSLPNKTHTAEVNNASRSPEGHYVDRSNNEGSKEGPNDAVESFEAVLGTLKRSRESITRATHIAIECAKMGTASRVVEIITCNLENETSLHRKVDLLFLIDSITQFSRGMKGTLGGVYLQEIQSVLSRLIPAAAPPGSTAQENRRQCLKVLRVWLERRLFPESIIRQHIRELDALCCSSSAGISSRSMKTERAFDDPIRQMEGMMVDEYGSNSSIQLPGFCMPLMTTDGDGVSDSDEEIFEAVTPEHITEYGEGSRAPAIEKHPHILEDVDGELEMEDLAPSCEVDSSPKLLVGSAHSKFDHFEHVTLPIVAKTKQPSTSPMPVVSLPPPPPPPPSQQERYSSSMDMKDDVQESFSHRAVPSRGNSFRHHGPDRRDFPHNPSRKPEGRHTHTPSSSYNSRLDLHSSSRPGCNIQANDDSHKGFNLRPPHPAPSNQFSYAHSDQRMPSGRGDVPPNPHRYHMAHCSDDANFFRDRSRMKHTPRDMDDCWRSPAPPPFSGPCHPDFPRRPHGPVPYSGPPREPAFPNQRWSNHHRGMNHREYMPHRPPPAGSNYWRPR